MGTLSSTLADDKKCVYSKKYSLQRIVREKSLLAKSVASLRTFFCKARNCDDTISSGSVVLVVAISRVYSYSLTLLRLDQTPQAMIKKRWVKVKVIIH